jgi:hypothetical protein
MMGRITSKKRPDQKDKKSRNWRLKEDDCSAATAVAGQADATGG